MPHRREIMAAPPCFCFGRIVSFRYGRKQPGRGEPVATCHAPSPEKTVGIQAFLRANRANPRFCRKNAPFRGDKPLGNGRQSLGNCGVRILPLGTASGALLSVAVIGGLLGLAPAGAHGQWWRSGPADFEDCAAPAEKAANKEEKAARLSECNAKFAGRRKPGGGYAYFDFMQNRNFDIAGPNPTPEEQKKIDEEYINYLERERRNGAAAALAAKPHEQPQQQQPH